VRDRVSAEGLAGAAYAGIERRQEVAVTLRIVVGLAMTAIALAIAVRRVRWLYRVAISGQPAPERVAAAKENIGRDLRIQLSEVFGQRKLLKWSVPGLAHFFVFWAFVILLTVYIEAYGSLFSKKFHIPFIGHFAVLGFGQDSIDYGPHTHHTNLDTYERIIEDDVKSSATVIAAVLYELAMRDEMVPRFPADKMPPLPAARGGNQ